MAESIIQHLRPAAFFDRDGVLDVDRGYVYRPEDFEWMEGAKEAIRLLNGKGYLVFVVTNQSGVARGYYTEQDVRNLHNWMNRELKTVGAHIDAFYYCPHHPEALLDCYKGPCRCRKPEPGLIMQAMAEWPVDKTRSFMVGDKKTDVAAAAAAGIPGYIFSGGSLQQFVRDLIARMENP